MKSYEETRRIIRDAIKDYSNNTHAVAKIMIEVLTHDITCSQFDKFFEMLIDRVLHYHNHKTYEDIIVKNSNNLTNQLKIELNYEDVVDIATSLDSNDRKNLIARLKETSPNSDNEDEETTYSKNLDTIGQAVSDVVDCVYDGKDYIDKEYSKLVSDLANAIYEGTSPMLAIDLAKELLALNDDTLDSNDISEIINLMDYNHDCVDTMNVAIREYISKTSQANMQFTLGYIAHIVSSCTNIENYSLFYALVQKELMERLNKEGENTDVF